MRPTSTASATIRMVTRVITASSPSDDPGGSGLTGSTVATIQTPSKTSTTVMPAAIGVSHGWSRRPGAAA